MAFNSNSLTRWMELHHHNIFKKFEDYAAHSELFNRNETIHQQDYTMFIGMILAFLKENGMSGNDIREAVIKDRIEKLQLKFTGESENKKQSIFKSLLG